MKVVQGNYRQYQLVDKTRKKDIDGIRYLIAGERNLWAKLLRDKSETKKAEIYNLITRNGSTGFEMKKANLSDIPFMDRIWTLSRKRNRIRGFRLLIIQIFRTFRSRRFRHQDQRQE